MRGATNSRFAILGCVVGLCLLGAAPASAATTFTPNTFGDPAGATHCTPPLPAGGCSLRGAIEDAQAGDTVQLAAGTYKLEAAGQLEVLNNITIVGAGPGQTTIEQTVAQRVMRVEHGLTMSGVTITGGEVVGKAGSPGSFPSGTGGNGEGAYGAGIEAGGPATLTDVVVTDNRAVGGNGGEGGQGQSGGNGTGGTGGQGGYADGAGIDGGPFVLTQVAITDNVAQAGAAGAGGFGTGTGNGGAGGAGGMAFGAGIAIGHASLTATDTLIADNTAATGAGGTGGLGGITGGDGGTGGDTEISRGGGIFSNGPVDLTNVTLTGNVAAGGIGGTGGAAFNTLGSNGGAGGSGSGANGGAIALFNGSTGNFASVTIAGNTATDGTAGAGGLVLSTSTTGPSGTKTPGEGGNILVYGGALALESALTLRDTIIAAGTAKAGTEDCAILGSYGRVTSAGHNLEEHHQCIATPAGGDLQNTAPGLGPLAANGGPTETMALLPGTAAIDAGETACVAADGSPLTEDQRGDPRGTPCDIGAFEVQPTPPPSPPSDNGGGGTSETGSTAGSSGSSVPPTISELKLAPEKVRAGKKVTVSFRLSAATPVTFSLGRDLPGIKVGKKCVAPSKVKGHKRCTRSVAVKGGPSSTHGTAGSDGVSWTPRGLKPGRYTLTASLADGSAVSAKFVVQAPKKSKR